MSVAEFDVGDDVRVFERNGGFFTGVIVGFGTYKGEGYTRKFFMDGTRHVMVIQPHSRDLINYFGGAGTTEVGAAHWDQSVRLLSG
jgi:hypothetical protein